MDSVVLKEIVQSTDYRITYGVFHTGPALQSSPSENIA